MSSIHEIHNMNNNTYYVRFVVKYILKLNNIPTNSIMYAKIVYYSVQLYKIYLDIHIIYKIYL